MSASIDAGDTAPDFTAPTDGGGTLSLSELRGGPVVLYFYPRDDTPGCTKESIGFSEALADFTALGARIVGVSKDTVAKHDKFKAKYGLRFNLVSDADGEICESYGVWVEKSQYGRTHMGIERSTFLIGADGTVRNVWRKVKVNGHVEAVLEAAKALG